MNQGLKDFSFLGIIVGAILLFLGLITVVNHGVPREPLPLSGYSDY